MKIIQNIFIGCYFSIFALLSTVVIETIFMDGVTLLSFVSAVFTFPFGLYFSNGYIKREYNLSKSLLVGIAIMLLSLFSFFIFMGIGLFISIPEPTIQEVIFAPLIMFFITLLWMGIVMFPTAAISGAILHKVLSHYNKIANK